jgi:hypothetical protein
MNNRKQKTKQENHRGTSGLPENDRVGVTECGR